MEAVTARHGQLEAVSGVALKVELGDRIAIGGANGAGKTTFLRTLAGAHPATSGRIFFQETDITLQAAYKRVGLGLALAPEGRRLFPDMSVEENLALARHVGRRGAWTMDRVMNAFPNLKERRKARAGTLSGGEQQATAIGRALMTNPVLLLLDEVSLDVSPLAVDRVYDSLETLKGAETAMIFVEHDLDRAFALATRMLCMLEGRVVLDGAPDSLTREEVTQAYFGLGRPSAETR